MYMDRLEYCAVCRKVYLGHISAIKEQRVLDGLDKPEIVMQGIPIYCGVCDECARAEESAHQQPRGEES